MSNRSESDPAQKHPPSFAESVIAFPVKRYVYHKTRIENAWGAILASVPENIRKHLSDIPTEPLSAGGAMIQTWFEISAPVSAAALGALYLKQKAAEVPKRTMILSVIPVVTTAIENIPRSGSQMSPKWEEPLPLSVDDGPPPIPHSAPDTETPQPNKTPEAYGGLDGATAHPSHKLRRTTALTQRSKWAVRGAQTSQIPRGPADTHTPLRNTDTQVTRKRGKRKYPAPPPSRREKSKRGIRFPFFLRSTHKMHLDGINASLPRQITSGHEPTERALLLLGKDYELEELLRPRRLPRMDTVQNPEAVLSELLHFAHHHLTDDKTVRKYTNLMDRCVKKQNQALFLKLAVLLIEHVRLEAHRRKTPLDSTITPERLASEWTNNRGSSEAGFISPFGILMSTKQGDQNDFDKRSTIPVHTGSRTVLPLPTNNGEPPVPSGTPKQRFDAYVKTFLNTKKHDYFVRPSLELAGRPDVAQNPKQQRKYVREALRNYFVNLRKQHRLEGITYAQALYFIEYTWDINEEVLKILGIEKGSTEVSQSA